MQSFRSSATTQGRRMAGARALWRATGMKTEDFQKPIIAIANSFTQFVPGHVHLHPIGQKVKEVIDANGGYGVEFNTIAVDDYKVVNAEGLRYSSEFIRHKILDTIGDISLLGYELAGKITTHKSGHYLHNVLCRKILETPSCYEIVSASSLAQETREAHKLPQTIGLATS